MASQRDSRIQVLIGKATQSDNAVVRVISFLGFIFLPGTFLSVCPPPTY
jgi:hypothetical protein